MFDGETKTFVFKKNGKEKALKIKKANDALNAITSSRISSGSISFDPKRENGLYLEFSIWESGGVSLMTIIEMDGEKVIQEDEYNLEEKGLVPEVTRMIDLIERMSSTSSVWDEVSPSAEPLCFVIPKLRFLATSEQLISIEEPSAEPR